MPYRTYWQERGILWEFYGDVTADEIEEANTDFYRDERSDRARFQIIDARQVTSVEWAERDIKITAAYDIGAASVLKDVKVAYVADNVEILSLLDQYAELSRRLTSSWQFQGFTDLDSALDWAMP